MSTVKNTVRTAVREAIDAGISEAVTLIVATPEFVEKLGDKIGNLIDKEVDTYFEEDEVPQMSEKQMLDTPPEDSPLPDSTPTTKGEPMPIDVAERPAGVTAVNPDKEYMQPHTPEQASATKKMDQLTESGQEFIDSLNI